MEVKLVVVGGDAKPTEINVKLPAIIGRGRSAALTLPHPLVSRQHCELYESDGKLFVRDLGSLNGTFVGEEKIEEAALDSGSLLTVGNVTFRPIYGDQPADSSAGDVEFEIVAETDDEVEPMDLEAVVDDEIEEVAEIDEIEEIDESDFADAEIVDVEEVAEIDPLDPPEPELRQTVKVEETEVAPSDPGEKKEDPTEKAPDQKPSDSQQTAEQDDQFLSFLDDDEDDEAAADSDDDDLSSFLKGFNQ